jgi:hypothetical protein
LIAQVIQDYPGLVSTVGKLSRWFIFAVLYAERDGEGRVIQPRGDKPTETLADRYRTICRRRGMAEHRIDAKIALMLAENQASMRSRKHRG